MELYEPGPRNSCDSRSLLPLQNHETCDLLSPKTVMPFPLIPNTVLRFLHPFHSFNSVALLVLCEVRIFRRLGGNDTISFNHFSPLDQSTY
ncbi:hypothetical protein P8452_33225 [Trifolium repens]|nr:hypothetical protein P8452_33225 [Trifolium repens]